MQRVSQLIRFYYYLAPVWFLVEAFLMPGVRAGPIVGRSILGLAVFYGIESGIGAAFWRKIPWAGNLALAQNVIYLVSIIRFIIFTPLDLVTNIESEVFASAAQEYTRAIPGMTVSLFQATAQIYAKIYGSRLGADGGQNSGTIPPLPPSV